MKKFLIILIIIALTSLTLLSCLNKDVEIDNPTIENLESDSEITGQLEKQSAGSIEEKKYIVMSITPKEANRIISEGIYHFLLDVRTVEEYSQGHIDGAYLIPVQELKSRLDEIPKDRQIIVYCESGNRSRTAVNILMENGFGMVFDMGGIDDWQNMGYPIVIDEETAPAFEEIAVDEAYKIFTGENYLFIDVRYDVEYNSEHIEGAINIPVSEIESRLAEIPKDKIIVTYCNGSSCNRSSQAANILIENGYEQVYNMGGEGIFEWIEKGYPVVE